MPELPEVEAARRLLEPAMRGARFERVLVRRPDLRRAFPADFAGRLTGTTVDAVTRRAKYLLLPLSSGDVLLMHLGMSGDFRVEMPGHDVVPLPTGTHDHVVFGMSSGATVTFTDPRRFGAMDLLTLDELNSHQTLTRLGPEPLSREFDAAALAAACRGRDVSLKAALLDQRVVAGLGNIYAVDALHLAGLSPFKRAATLATPTGKPRPAAGRLAAAIRHVIARAVARESRVPYRATRFRVYDRENAPCPTHGCRGTIRRVTQAGRSTFFCPVCQR